MGLGDFGIQFTDSLLEVVNDVLLITLLELEVDDPDIVHTPCEQQINHFDDFPFTGIVKLILNDFLHKLVVN